MPLSTTPFLPEKIPLSGFPIASLNISLATADFKDAQPADIVITAVKAAATTGDATSTESHQSLGISSNLDKALEGAITEACKRHSFDAKEGKTIATRLSNETLPFAHLGVVGVGDCRTEQASILAGFDLSREATAADKPLSSFVAYRLGRPLASLVTSNNAKNVALYVQEALLPPRVLQTLLESTLLALTPDNLYKSKKGNAGPIQSLQILIEGDVANYSNVFERARQFAAGANLTKELAYSPPNYCNPLNLAQVAVDLAQESGLEHRVLGLKECEERGMGAFLGVNQGSMFPPQFIHLTYKPAGVASKKVAIVGKAVCMDTGGYDIKSGAGSLINLMKYDMASAAAVLGAARIIGGMKPKGVEVHFVAAATENMVSSTAYRPGDILTASNGTTIEIGNTDAEGRLCLADALVYVNKEIQPDFTIDCATLTGACVIALGWSVAAIYGTDDNWTKTVLAGARNAGEALWPLPLYAPYFRSIEGQLADLANVSSVPKGGSITAALFLREFIKGPWCHIDMAGPAIAEKDTECTGYGARLLAETVLSVAKDE